MVMLKMDTNGHDELSNCWKGTSLSDLYRNKGPWSFRITPITVSKYSSVLYELPVTLKNPPKPHVSSKPLHWDENHVRMPFSEQNLYPVNENDNTILKQRWKLIKESLSQKINNSRELEKAIKSYNNGIPNLELLHYFFEQVVEEDDATVFFNNLFPKIVKLALDLPEILPGSLPLLKRGNSGSISLSQLQIASLLANAFLCTFPWRKDMAGSYPGVNFTKLFTAYSRRDRRDAVIEKLKCIIHYFRRITNDVPLGVVTFERKCKSKFSMHRWDTSEMKLGNTKVHISSEGTIESDGTGFLQVDFANKNVGGGVLGYGCVQEEIRFVICPELLVSRLFVERLGDHEAVIVYGPEQYSKYSGYSDTFTWDGDFKDQTPFDEYGRRRTSICIIDATHYSKQMDQYFPSAMLRELNKAYVGFSSKEKENLAPVATGNWGCGAFQGSSYLKALLQLMACSAAGRDLVYFTFGDVKLRDEFYDMYMFLSSNNVNIRSLWRFLCKFSKEKKSGDLLYAFIQQAFFDSVSQEKISQFFPTKPEEQPCSSKDLLYEELKISFHSVSKTSKDHVFGEVESKSDSTQMDWTCSASTSDRERLSPTLEMKKSDKLRQSKAKLSDDDILKKLPKTNIIELMENMNGKLPVKNSREESFLSDIDKIAKKMKVVSDEHGTVASTSKDPEEEPVLTNGIKPKKISDYFQKIS